MNYTKGKNFLKIFGKDDFNAEHILECGQIFSYKKIENGFLVLSADKKCEIVETDDGFLIKTTAPTYFENFFDLKTDYGGIKKKLEKFDIMKEPIKFGYGIRILKQNLFETLISFIVSANNNIKRIQMILNRMREKFGTKISDFYAFPTQTQLLSATEDDFTQMGAGYRAKYLFKVVRQVDEKILDDWKNLPTKELRNKLISLAGVGPKVADCVLLFGYGRGDVFPVDTWIAKMYNKYYVKLENREQIRQNLTEQFGELSGYAQQYLFYFMRAS